MDNYISFFPDLAVFYSIKDKLSEVELRDLTNAMKQLADYNYQTGMSETDDSKYDDGYFDGKQSGYNEGYLDGYDLGYDDACKAATEQLTKE